jgi:tRNA G18 (ribose-2'-O)-methylase SpoU
MSPVAILTTVDDVADPRVDDFRDLTAADRRPDRPGGRGLVIAEGVVVVRRLLDSSYPVRSLLGVPRRLAELDLSAVDAPAYAATAHTMARIVGFHLNRGVLAVADRAPTPSVADLAKGRVLAVLEGVNDHENLGALFRNAAALGVDGVLLGPRCADPLYRRSVRVSMGHVLRVPFAPLPEPWPLSLAALDHTIVALTPIQLWRYYWFGTTADSGAAADTAISSSDGMANLLKYGLGLNPIAPTSNPVIGDIATGFLRLTSPKSPDATDVSFHAEIAPNLMPPVWTTNGTTIDQNTATLFQAHANAPVSSNTNAFIRLRVSRP